ncbi:MAG TPA: O-antigen ligase family protein [Terriglobales bacterium]|nr:O-antigen ligase family protein [Terriglobales bacterium]
MAAAPVRVISMATPAVTTVEHSRAERALEFLSLYGTLAVLVFGPLAFGAVEPWSVFILEISSAALLLAWTAKQIVAGRIHIQWSPVFAPMLFFAVVIACQLLFGSTAYRYATTAQSLRYVMYGTLCFVALQALDSPGAQTRFARVLSWSGFALAVFALIQGLSSNGKLYWLRTPTFGGSIYGPYVNHNHYAGLMEMLTPLPLMLCLSGKFGGAQKFLLAFASLIMAATIFTSGSRGGMVAFACEAVLFAALVYTKNKSVTTILTAATFALLLGSIVAWLGWSTVAARWHEVRVTHGVELSISSRLAIDKDALHMFAAHPLLGWGLGNFPTAYPQFRSFFTDMYVNAAHNDYLQMLVETGAFGGAAMIWFVILVFRAGIRQTWLPHRRGFGGGGNQMFMNPLATAALIGCAGLLVHSLVDFNLQIPANAALFYVLASVACAHVNAPELD